MLRTGCRVGLCSRSTGPARFGRHERWSAHNLGELPAAALGERVVEHGGPQVCRSRAIEVHVASEGHVVALENGDGETSWGVYRARLNTKTDRHLPKVEVAGSSPVFRSRRRGGSNRINRAARVIPFARDSLVRKRPSSRYENNGEEGRWGTPNRPLWMATRFQRIPLRAL